MFYGNAPAAVSALFITCTSVAYISFMSIVFPAFDYPSWVISAYSWPLMVPMIVYSVFFVVRGAVLIAKEMKKQGE
jgi:hypothetical protein